MPKANSDNSTSMPAVSTRRRFLSQAAGVAAGGTVLALATIPPASAVAALAGLPDPVFGLIEAHRTAHAAHLVDLEEQNRLDRIGDRSSDWVAEETCQSDMAAFNDLILTAPTTFAGLLAWAAYLDDIRREDEWAFDEFGWKLVMTLGAAVGNLAVTS
jgi:hypothetical protein